MGGIACCNSDNCSQTGGAVADVVVTPLPLTLNEKDFMSNAKDSGTFEILEEKLLAPVYENVEPEYGDPEEYMEPPPPPELETESGHAETARYVEPPPRPRSPPLVDEDFEMNASKVDVQLHSELTERMDHRPQVVEHGENIIAVTLDRTSDAHLGVGVLPGPHGKGAKVTNLQETGLVAAWNATNPEAQLRVGDIIVDVNGVSGDHANIVKACAPGKVLVMKILKV
mmetsp:Transcript_107625/g.303099  ORF Transcript_107625/g.303099 Transcript_107625/m.303099 type:complete len:227 (-) Transcript_107625:152-832(-)